MTALGVIGGTGVEHLEDLRLLAELELETP